MEIVITHFRAICRAARYVHVKDNKDDQKFYLDQVLLPFISLKSKILDYAYQICSIGN